MATGVLVRRLCVAACLTASACGEAAAEPELGDFPLVSEAPLEEYPEDIEALRRLADAGDPYAEFYLGALLECEDADDTCLSEQADHYRRSMELGFSGAAVYLMHQQIAQTGETDVVASLPDRVCNRTIEDREALIAEITAIDIPGYGRNQNAPEPWEVWEALGNRGSELTSLSAGPMSVSLVFNDEQLRQVRVYIAVLNLGSYPESGSEARWDASTHFNSAVAEIICPGWAGLANALDYYYSATLVWPPSPVFHSSEHGLLGVGAVVPDIYWYVIYVDPMHEPFISSVGDEEFEPVERE
ncbi:MAG: hypothetical protein PVI23_01895 [Maricaulaceae bacterium]|jgi:TPR repeat protein